MLLQKRFQAKSSDWFCYLLIFKHDFWVALLENNIGGIIQKITSISHMYLDYKIKQKVAYR